MLEHLGGPPDFQADGIIIRELEFNVTGQNGPADEQLFVILHRPPTRSTGTLSGQYGFGGRHGPLGTGVRFPASGPWHGRIAPGFSSYLACHFTLRFAVVSVRSGEQEVSSATRSNKPFWILPMPHRTARPATGTLSPAGHYLGGISPGGRTT